MRWRAPTYSFARISPLQGFATRQLASVQRRLSPRRHQHPNAALYGPAPAALMIAPHLEVIQLRCLSRGRARPRNLTFATTVRSDRIDWRMGGRRRGCSFSWWPARGWIGTRSYGASFRIGAMCGSSLTGAKASAGRRNRPFPASTGAGSSAAGSILALTPWSRLKNADRDALDGRRVRLRSAPHGPP